MTEFKNMKKIFITFFAILFLGCFSFQTQAQRKAVSGAEVTGTFVYNFTGKYKGNSNEIKILALGGGKLKLAFDLVYPFFNGKEPMVNVGQAEGEATISGDTAVFTNPDDSSCKITIKFVRPGLLNVSQKGGTACGFGLNVTADGAYRKTSSKKPVF